MKPDLSPYINLVNEVGMLFKTPRSGFAFLGSGSQSVAEHSYRTAWIALLLAELTPEEPKPNRERVMFLALIHDLPEARTGDLNYVNKKYVEADERKASQDIRDAYPCGQWLYDALMEYQEGQTIEARLAHDADQLEMLFVLKQEMETGNSRALRWFEKTRQRLYSPIAQQIADAILATDSDAWWCVNLDDPHWIHGGKNVKKDPHCS